MKTSVKAFTKIYGNTMSYSMNGIKANARIRVEQGVDRVLKNIKLNILGQPHDELLMLTDSWYKNYKANEDRIIPKDGLLFRNFFGETGSIKSYQNLIPKHLVNEVLRSVHGEFGKHAGISKTIIAFGKNIIFQKWRNWSGRGSRHVSNSSENHELTVVSPALTCKTQMSTLPRPKMPCKKIWCRNYRHLLAMKTLWQPWNCFPVTYSHTRNQIRTPKQSLNS